MTDSMEPTNVRTDHSVAIQTLREANGGDPNITQEIAADLLQMHDDTSLSLDNWDTARKLVEFRVGDLLDDMDWKIQENGA